MRRWKSTLSRGSRLLWRVAVAWLLATFQNGELALRLWLQRQVFNLNDLQHSSLCLIFNRLPFSFVTDDVVQATCQCLLAQAADAENVSLICFVPFEILYKSWLPWRTEEPLGSCSRPIITRSDLNSLLLLIGKKSDKNLPGHIRSQPYWFRRGEVLCVRKFSYVLVWRKTLAGEYDYIYIYILKNVTFFEFCRLRLACKFTFLSDEVA